MNPIMTAIPFSRSFLTGNEMAYISDAIKRSSIGAGGYFTKQCESRISQYTGGTCAMLTNSCTAALEMAVILSGLGVGDEVIMPSFTFPSTANACLLRGAKPVFVDIRSDTLNIDEEKIEAAITNRTKAIIVVHYAGVACEMNVIMGIAEKHGLIVIEDAAQGFLSSYEGRALGTIGSFGALSFHSTKNISCGEGGALLINDNRYIKKAEILRDKGTNRQEFLEGRILKYSWVGLGPSASMGELSAAYLLAQLEAAEEITSSRIAVWNEYDREFMELDAAIKIKTPCIPKGSAHNGHIYYVLASSKADRDRAQARLKESGIESASHYEPLHSSSIGAELCEKHAVLLNTESISERILRLPLWPGLLKSNVHDIASAVKKAFY